jgi:hypothetical protein
VEQAAEILGASRWRTVFEIVLPLIRSGLVATFLFILILTWSEYLLALIITKTQVSTLPIELSKYQGSTEGRVYGRQAALAVGITIPLMIVGLSLFASISRGDSVSEWYGDSRGADRAQQSQQIVRRCSGGQEPELHHRRRRVRRVRRAVRLRQDDHLAHDCRVRGSDLRGNPHRRARGERSRATRP